MYIYNAANVISFSGGESNISMAAFTSVIQEILKIDNNQRSNVLFCEMVSNQYSPKGGARMASVGMLVGD